MPRFSLLPGLLLLVLAGGAVRSNATEVTFRFEPSDNVGLVSVAGTFNEWNPAAALMIDPDEDGVWTITLDIAEGTHQYKFVVGGSTWFTDETAQTFADDGFGGQNSVMEVGPEPFTVGEPDTTEVEDTRANVTFRYQPSTDRIHAVSVAGSFNDWNAAADLLSDEDGDGIWELTVRLEPGKYAYQFVEDGLRWYTDQSVVEQEIDRFGDLRALITVESESIVTGP